MKNIKHTIYQNFGIVHTNYFKNSMKLMKIVMMIQMNKQQKNFIKTSILSAISF